MLELIAREEADGTITLLSPHVGVYAGRVTIGSGLPPGSTVGTLTVLGHVADLVVPPSAEGRIKEHLIAHSTQPVAYGEPLMRLDALKARASSRSSRGRRTSGREDKNGPPGASAAPRQVSGQHALVAPTTGIFYARPDPTSAPFVSVGSILEAGQTAGLIEVMKCFSPIVHPGGTIPSPARILSIAVREGEEVGPGQVLFVLAGV